MTDKEIFELDQSQLLAEVKQLKNEGYRLVTISAVDLGDKLDLIYHFDQDLKLKNMRVQMEKSQEFQSISSIYFCALLVENEIQDYFGVNFKDLVLDYKGHFYLEDEVQRAPYCAVSIRREQGGKK
ncbi:NADH-quinone oxidoreductase subunit C [Desulfohalobiaceae bacterium Ax17]|uniref:NADH-quinone oxidoreductase subunit C n=1 Tax=Desulfovulcanus ferrireducens TaxID=2831190 RepID=UPI00207B9A41|nr:NADH-quinone oxidoreductase subunit C [Desulfovulcanus ferrireducens]MBT8764121.1 NADH-quinone oxidoreductase subunit C [Desulfovulcanus ferrireducens]